MASVKVHSDNVQYTDEGIESTYHYNTTSVTCNSDGSYTAVPKENTMQFKTDTTLPKLGMMLVGLGGNNGSTVAAGIIANRNSMTWNTKEGEKKSNYFGSITQAGTVCLGMDAEGKEVYVPFNDVIPMVHPNDIEVDGWDISSMNLADAMERACVLDYSLQKQIRPHLQSVTPRPSIYCPDFIAANREARADNTLSGTKAEMLQKLRNDIKDFKEKKGLDKVIVLWTANTERFCDIKEGLNTTAEELMNSIERNEEEVSPSTIFAVASILEGCTYINGSPQNTFVPGCIELAEMHQVYIAGDDFKSGQTKYKSVLVDFLVGAGIKPVSIVSYNHLGNNDGCNLSAPSQFRSKEISKSNVVDDMVESNKILYPDEKKPDHTVVIKYVPYVRDSKRAMDEYISEIFMGGTNTIVCHNTCEDSLLASPIILDLVILAELCERITIRMDNEPCPRRMHSILSILSYLIKAPLVPKGTPVVNALFKQRACIENIVRACVGLQPNNHMMMEHKMGAPVQSGFNMSKMANFYSKSVSTPEVRGHSKKPSL